MVPVSIIIPVFNQWVLTRACLRSIRATAPAGSVEVILVDNASTDVTSRAAPFLGNELFGDDFSFIRNEENRNFAGASNQGASAASGDFLLFLNNDTVMLPGWLEPLLGDFREYPDLAGTGPLLLYPEKPLIGHTIQHLGVAVSPFRNVNHLYEGIPTASALARKRRFFQIITAACMMMPKDLFRRMDGFDEEYRNGMEDVDLCARLSASGYRFTVNPNARVIHYQGQSAGRNAAEAENSKRVQRKALPLLKPDKVRFLEEDGMSLGLNDWQIQAPMLKTQIRNVLESKVDSMSQEELLAALTDSPYWSNGWKRLLAGISDQEREALAEPVYRLAPEPAVPMGACRAAMSLRNQKRARYWFNTASVFCRPETVYQDLAESRAVYAFSIGEPGLGKEYEDWASKEQQFFRDDLRPFIADFARLAKELKIDPGNASPWAFALDFDLGKDNPYGGDAERFNASDYRKMYGDVASLGCDPWLHYLGTGKAEGRKRKPCVSSIDYSRLTPERIAEWKAAPKSGVVVCTALADDYERLLPPAFLNDGWRYVCYTDSATVDSEIWESRRIPFDDPDPVRRARWVKLHLPELFPDAEWVIWMDANIVIVSDLSGLLDRKEALSLIPHPVRSCPYEEGVTCVKAGKDSAETIERQLSFYRSERLPANSGLWETNVMLVKPSDKSVGKVFADWWDELDRHSRRDQISLPYVLFRNGLKPVGLFPEDRSAHDYPGVCYLTHQETLMHEPPTSCRD